jgi:hypothetical protein
MPNAGGTQLDKDSIGQKGTSFSSHIPSLDASPASLEKRVSTCSDYSGHDNHCDARQRGRGARMLPLPCRPGKAVIGIASAGSPSDALGVSSFRRRHSPWRWHWL